MQTKPGRPTPLGLSISGNCANFALYSSHADRVTLGLFEAHQDYPVNEIPLLRTRDVWHIGIEGLPADVYYAYRCEGPRNLLYNPKAWLIDPYAKIVLKGKAKAAAPPPFKWGSDRPPQIPHSELIVYEMHVRGFTKDASSRVKHPGTYLGMIEKIPYLKKLGINAVELMPVFGFDPHFCKNIHPTTEQKLPNYWGYNPLHFFAPTDWYAVEDPVTEFKTLVRELHQEGIEIILDAVYNHTGEEDNLGYYVNFRGIDNSVYYLLNAEGKYLNFSGCGNTLHTNHPAVENLILDSLRYWIEEMHVDGFRLDLASILTRGPSGDPLNAPSILEAIRKDRVISQVKLIAEPWDASGLYQIGYFAKRGSWIEWNGEYRDSVRRFIKGTNGYAGKFADVISGSEMIYHSAKTPLRSLNFITAHDGFTLRDLTSYQERHNHDNGEGNRDGNPQNESWNCGHEGESPDPQIRVLRERQMRNFLLALFVSQGIPMLLMGDEYGHTRYGNNNPYVQDNEINWFLWDRQDPKILEFVSFLIRLRSKHPLFRRSHFLTDQNVEWFSSWEPSSRLVAYMLKDSPSFYVAFNADFNPTHLSLPKGPWNQIIDTSEDWICHEAGPPIHSVHLPPYSALLAVRDD